MKTFRLKLFSSHQSKTADKNDEEKTKKRQKAKQDPIDNFAASGGSFGGAIGSIFGLKSALKADSVSDKANSRLFKAALDHGSNNLKYTVSTGASSAAESALRNEGASVKKLTEATKRLAKATGSNSFANQMGKLLIGAGVGVAAGSLIGAAAKKSKKKKAQKKASKEVDESKLKKKTFSDKSASWFEAKANEFDELVREATDPKKKAKYQHLADEMRRQKDHALVDEAKVEGASQAAKDAAKKAQERINQTASSGSSSFRGSRGGGSGAYSNFKDICNGATRNATRNNSRAEAAERLAKRVERQNKKMAKAVVGVGLGAAATYGAVKAYQHYKNKKAA